VPGESLRDYGVYYFRKSISLKNKPDSFIVHVSADNRYKLYINQTLVSLGPARGDTYYWNYETVDLAPYLKAGDNTIAAVVWNDGDYRPEAQISIQTGFIMQGDGETEAIVNTDKTGSAYAIKRINPLLALGMALIT
jgi:alpha-L-rhamnosidase